MYFLLFLQLNTIENPRHYIWNKYKKTLKGREKRWMWQGPQDLRNNTVVSAQGFLLACLSQIWSWRSQQPRSANGHRWRKLQKQPALSSKRARRGAARKDRKLLHSNCFTLVKHQRKTVAPATLTSAKAKWDPRLPPAWGCNKHPNTLVRWGQRKQIGSQDCHQGRCSPIPWVRGTWGLWIISHCCIGTMQLQLSQNKKFNLKRLKEWSHFWYLICFYGERKFHS